MTITLCYLFPTLSHLQPLQDENCESNSRRVVDEDGNDKFRLERVKYFFKFMLFGMNRVFTHEHMQMFGLKIE